MREPERGDAFHRAAPARVRLPVVQRGSAAPAEVPLRLAAEPSFPPDLPLFDRAALRLDERKELRTSSYTIYADVPGNDEEVLLIHGYTGAFDKVSRPVAAYLRAQEAGPRHRPLHGDWSPEPLFTGEIPTPSDATLQKLRKRGYLTPLTLEEEESFFTKMAAQRHHQAARRAPGYVIVPTYECNLRCPYCFQDHMRTDPSYRHLLRVMQPGMADRVLRGMSRIEAAHGIPAGAEVTRNIIFFGGEPLLAESRPVIEYLLCKLGEAGKVNVSAISNATELDAYEDLLGPGKISFLQITLDGPPAEHDRRRIYPDGSGSFERIARNIDMALGRGAKISLRMNIDRRNIELLPELGDEIVRRGWDRQPGFSAYVAPIHGEEREDHELKTTFNTFELNDALSRMKERHPGVRSFGGQDDGLVQRLRQIFDQRTDPLPAFRSDFCSAHTTMYILDAFGDIYACWERMGDPGVRIGFIDEQGEVFMSPAVIETWRNRSVTSNVVCRRCRYASYCGGGCAVLAEGQNGSIHSNHCDGFGKRFRQSAANAYQDHLSGVAFMGNADRICDL